MGALKPLLAAAAGQTPSRRPVWFMRQAGRSLPEYRALRADRGMLEACFDPAMVCEITMQPVRRHDTDGAILFSDIVVPLKAAGIDLDIVAGTGPVIANPVRTAADVAAIGRLDPAAVGAIGSAVSLLRAELDPTPTTLIGFAGAPFTLASYLIEGGPSRNYAHTKAMMYGNPILWNDLMARLADITVTFLRVQLEAGVQAVQLFDSWAGMLSRRDYETYVAPHSTRVFAEVTAAAEQVTGGAVAVPRIHFGVGTGELLLPMSKVGVDVVGVDWRVPLDEAIRRIGPGQALQGNLDPTILFAGDDVVAHHVARVIADADAAVAAGARGHIFNLGHGVLPDTDPDVITRVVDLVHSA